MINRITTALAICFILAVSAGNSVIAAPVLSVSNVDFGVVVKGGSRTAPMRVCNTGDSILTLSQGTLIHKLSGGFTIAPAELERLRLAQLDAGECIDIALTSQWADI